MEPSIEGRLTTERRYFLPSTDEYLLRQVVGRFFPSHPSREAVDPGHAGPVQSLERTRVPFLGEGDIVPLNLHDDAGGQIAQVSLPLAWFLSLQP